MTPAEYGFAVGQGISSNLLMGMREARARQELSLREKAFMAEQQMVQDDLSLRNRDMAMRENESRIRVRAANDAFDFKEAEASVYPEIDSQFNDLDRFGVNDDVDGLRQASFKPLVLPSTFSRRTQDNLNAVKAREFNERREALLGQSNGAKLRRQNLEDLVDYGNYLGSVEAGEDFVNFDKSDTPEMEAATSGDAARFRQLAAEAHMFIRNGMSFSQLPAEHAAVLTKANRHSAKKTLAASEKMNVAAVLAGPRQAAAANTAKKTEMDRYQEQIKAIDDEIKVVSDQIAGVNIVDAGKDYNDSRVELVNWLNDKKANDKKAIALYQNNQITKAQLEQTLAGEELHEVTYEFKGKNGQTVTKKELLSGVEFDDLLEQLPTRQGRVVTHNAKPRPKLVKKPEKPTSSPPPGGSQK